MQGAVKVGFCAVSAAFFLYKAVNVPKAAPFQPHINAKALLIYDSQIFDP